MPGKTENELLDHDDLPIEQIQSALARVLESDSFSGSPRLCEFLGFLVEEELAGRGKRLNGTQIAIDVYGRNENFDPRTDPVVRTEAGRLRRALDKYYLTDGNQSPVRIQVPKGGLSASLRDRSRT